MNAINLFCLSLALLVALPLVLATVGGCLAMVARGCFSPEISRPLRINWTGLALHITLSLPAVALAAGAILGTLHLTMKGL